MIWSLLAIGIVLNIKAIGFVSSVDGVPWKNSFKELNQVAAFGWHL
jgi:hypothetical protein